MSAHPMQFKLSIEMTGFNDNHIPQLMHQSFKTHPTYNVVKLRFLRTRKRPRSHNFSDDSKQLEVVRHTGIGTRVETDQITSRQFILRQVRRQRIERRSRSMTQSGCFYTTLWHGISAGEDRDSTISSCHHLLINQTKHMSSQDKTYLCIIIVLMALMLCIQ